MSKKLAFIACLIVFLNLLFMPLSSILQESADNHMQVDPELHAFHERHINLT